ncbi:MAG: hypothetical protein FD123_3976 [Bacteroidetes bacterium]|nr:MAG: hypothetical protein FD123_3976 [Bacteroidota bacterium]
MKQAEGHKLGCVLYHEWVNKTNPGETLEFLDKLELLFDDGRLVFGTSENGEAICLYPAYDAESARLRLLHEFGGKIDIRSDDMSSNALWEIATGRRLESVEIAREKNGTYRNDCLMLDFEGERLEIRLGMDGLIVEPFEDV